MPFLKEPDWKQKLKASISALLFSAMTLSCIEESENTDVTYYQIIRNDLNPYPASQHTFYVDMRIPDFNFYSIANEPLEKCHSDTLPNGLTFTKNANGLFCELRGWPEQAVELNEFELIMQSDGIEEVFNLNIEVVQESIPTIYAFQYLNPYNLYSTLTIDGDFNQPYRFNVDWGDGHISYGVTGKISHKYDTAGIFNVALSGSFPDIFFDQRFSQFKQWGNHKWTSLDQMFQFGLTDFYQAIDTPDLTQATSLVGMFANTEINIDFSGWDVSNIENFNSMFKDSTITNINVKDWDTSKATNLSYMFENSTGLDQSLNNWDVSSVSNFEGMFSGSDFNSELNLWSTISATNMAWMFSDSNFNQDISNWTYSNIINFDNFLRNTTLSSENYDSLLIKLANNWALKSPPPPFFFDVGESQYTQASQTARDTLINQFGWNIQDGGLKL